MNVKWSEFLRRRSTTEPVFNKINIQIHAKNETETGYIFYCQLLLALRTAGN
jgi:hypothetical protein